MYKGVKVLDVHGHVSSPEATSNYLMLMMVDPHVHFHVIPRYAKPRRFADIDFPDSGWPGQPNLAAVTAISSDMQSQLRDSLRHHWPRD